MTNRERLLTATKKRLEKPMLVAENFRIHSRKALHNRSEGFSVYYVDGLAWPVCIVDTLDQAKAEVVARCLKNCEFVFDGKFTWDVKEEGK
jgi:hypothetical protein